MIRRDDGRTAACGRGRGVSAFVLLAVFLSSLPLGNAWQLWADNTTAPGPRDGHSLHIFDGNIILFGGRSNENRTLHLPKTFEIERVNGTLRFKSYASKVILECGYLDYDTCVNIWVGKYYNDLWTYPLDCERGWDTGCVDGQGWTQLDPGAIRGGCKLINNREICTHPQERNDHISALFPDGRLVLYGGFSRLCEDFCSDIWSVDLKACLRDREPVSPHELDEFKELTKSHSRNCTWRKLETLERTSPGRRRAMASAQIGNYWFFFGGQRLWHGFSPTNSLANMWANTDKYDYGGIFDDLWYLKYDGSDDSLMSTDAGSGRGGWKQLLPYESCYLAPPTLVFSDRNDVVCTLYWPSSRAWGALAAVHRSVFDDPEDPPLDINGHRVQYREGDIALYLHGGFTAPYPYPYTLGRGAGPGTATLGSDGPRPFPSHPYFLKDLWRYNLTTGLWKELRPTGISGSEADIPGARMGHTLTVAGGVLFSFGGRRYSDIYGETWMYNLRSGKWIRKDTHVHPKYPRDCLSDVELVSVPNSSIADWRDLRKLDWRATTAFPGDDGITGPTNWDGFSLIWGNGVNATVEVVKSYSVFHEPTRETLLDGQNGRWSDPIFVPHPRRRAPGWDGCRDREDRRKDLPQELQWVQPTQRFAHAAVYSEDLAILFLYGGENYENEGLQSDEATFPSTNVADLWYFNVQHCANNCSNHGECDYGNCHCNDGWYGIDCSNATCPGDYCHYDGDTFTTTCIHCASLPHVHFLRMWLSDPEVNKKEAFRMAFKQNLIADGLWKEEALDPEGDVYQHITRKTEITYLSLSESKARTRYLFDGSYNVYSDAQRFRRDKKTALEAASRLSHGQCNGFGVCVCAPPFMGDDCSIKGCIENCYGRGRCILEYPIARCECDPPYGGIDCQTRICPNNCSYPNGYCDYKGECVCNTMMNPFDRLQRFLPYGGDDCSFIMPFAGADSVHDALKAVWRVLMGQSKTITATTGRGGAGLAVALALAVVSMVVLAVGTNAGGSGVGGA